MKRIVHGRLYNTDDATTVCSWKEMHTICGFDLEVLHTLYREAVAAKPTEGLKLTMWGGVSAYDVKKDPSKGDWFVATYITGSYGSQGRIVPVGADEARRLFEEHTVSDYGLEDDYAKYFGVRPCGSDVALAKEAFAAGAKAQKKLDEEAGRTVE